MRDQAKPEEEDETQDLLLRIQGGDPRAFDELFTRHRAALYRAVARRIEPSLRSRVDPSDVVQEAQLDAALRLPDFIAQADAVPAVDSADCPAKTLEAQAARDGGPARRRAGPPL